jgi:hypothetical protein
MHAVGEGAEIRWIIVDALGDLLRVGACGREQREGS